MEIRKKKNIMKRLSVINGHLVSEKKYQEIQHCTLVSGHISKEEEQPVTSADVIVIGAGISGLRCASLLKKAGLDVKVLEARDRVGGRTYAELYKNSFVDLGGQWIGPQQLRINWLLEQYGMVKIPQYDTGKTVIELGGSHQVYDGVYPKAFDQCLEALDKMAAQIHPVHPWEGDNAQAWDKLTVHSWIQSTFSSKSGVLPDHTGIRGILASEPSEVSLLFWLWYIRAAGCMRVLSNTEGGAQQNKVKDSVWSLSLALYRELGSTCIRLKTAVQSIHQQSNNVLVRTINGQRFKAGRVVIAMAPALAAHITHIPQLPSPREYLQQRLPMGGAIKIIIWYKRAFWRDAGFSGLAISDKNDLQLVYDGCTQTKQGILQPALVAFILGSASWYWSSKDVSERQKSVLKALKRIFKCKEALQPLKVIEKDWCIDPWTRGAYTGIAAPGTISTAGYAMRKPVGRVHWAGTETAIQWPGYMEGACEAAERVTAEILMLDWENNIQLRSMISKDMAQVSAIEVENYSVDVIEGIEILDQLRMKFAEGCWVASFGNASEIVLGYLISFSCSRKNCPYELGSKHNDNDKLDCFYIHDVCIRRSAQKKGVASMLIQKARSIAIQKGFNIISLTAVNNSASYWKKHGFKIVPKKEISIAAAKRLSTYPDGAQMMEIRLVEI